MVFEFYVVSVMPCRCERFAARDLNMHVAASKLAREVREAVT